MMLRIIGAALLICGCGSFGFAMGIIYRREEKLLRWLLDSLQEMEWELKYRLTALPELCGIAASASKGKIRDLFYQLKFELESGVCTEISGCMNGLVQKTDLPYRCRKCLTELGKSLGRYDLEGQLQGLEAVRDHCKKYLNELEVHRGDRIRNYQTLALCAGVSVVILLV